MRAAVAAGVLAALTGCYAALPPPGEPHIGGTVASYGGRLGWWTMSTVEARPLVDGLDGIDLVDPAAPDHVLRVVRAPATQEDHGRYVEHVASRGVELRIASGGTEVVLTPDKCQRLDAIARAAHGVAFGSARFDCDLGDAGHVAGDVEFSAGGYAKVTGFSGHLEASDDALAHVRFEPDQGEIDPRGALLWDHRYPRVVFQIDTRDADPSVLGAASNAALTVTSTAGAVGSFAVEPARCRVLKMDRRDTGFVRIGRDQHTTWGGTIDVDCDTPHGGRLTGKLVLGG